MDRVEFENVAIALVGVAGWQTKIAKLLNVCPQPVRRWVAPGTASSRRQLGGTAITALYALLALKGEVFGHGNLITSTIIWERHKANIISQTSRETSPPSDTS